MPRGKGQGVDLTGRRFERLIVIGHGDGRSHRSWECRCDCGNAVFTDATKLTTGQKKSCGCLIAEARNRRLLSDDARQYRFALEVAARQIERPLGTCCIVSCGKNERSVGFCAHHYDMWNRFGHPLAGTLIHRRARTSSGKTKEYKAWNAMKSRCTNPNVKAWKGYGARGITVCQRWLASFEDFLVDLGRAPAGTSLERLNVNGNYEPSNCKWGTSREQMRNTRATVLTAEKVAEAKRRRADGESIANIAREFGLKYGTLYQAINGISWLDIESAGNG